MNWSKVEIVNDNGQDYQCFISSDISKYNTCPHECVYCYANTSKAVSFTIYKLHSVNPKANTITGK